MFDPSKLPSTLAEMAQRTFVSYAASPFLGVKNKFTKEYEYATYGQVGARVRSAAGGLLGLGLKRGDRAAILSENRPEWVIADLGCQMLGVISLPIYATLPAVQVLGILQDSGASVVFVSNAAQFKKIEEIRAQLPDLQVVVMEAEAVESQGDKVITFEELESRGQAYFDDHPGEYESTWPAAMADDIATIIYTSGTGGEPKGVMLTHRSIITNVGGFLTALQMSHEDTFLSFLPLAHVYERTAGYYLPLRLGASVGYCESLFTVDRNIKEVSPSIMLCVPRLYDSIREKLFSAADSLPEDQKGKYLDALALAQKAGSVAGHMPGAPKLSLIEQVKYKVYDGKVYAKIRERFGTRLRVFIAGGAPLPPTIGALFLGMGIEILEGYGLTETSPVIAVNRPHDIHLGTVGRILDGVEVKIEADGEICTRGTCVMKGYWNKPEATKQAIIDGWFHTGDIGALDDNILKITDRKKDLLVLANGKKVAPAPIELKLAQSSYITQVVLLGDKLKAVSALVVPQMENLKAWAKTNNIDTENEEALLADKTVKKLYKDEIEKFSDGLADFERIKKIALVPQPFTVEGGELTPTFKVKRRVVADKYAHLVGGEE